MRWSLESTLQIYDERMVDGLKDLFLRFHMFDLLQSDDLTLLQAFQGERLSFSRITLVLHESDAAKSSCSKS